MIKKSLLIKLIKIKINFLLKSEFCHNNNFVKNFSLANQIIPKFYVLDDSYNYGSEFYGIDQLAVITPLTERCFLSIWQACKIFKGSLLTGKPNVGKTQIAKVMINLITY